jgi:hypothetical protein
MSSFYHMNMINKLEYFCQTQNRAPQLDGYSPNEKELAVYIQNIKTRRFIGITSETEEKIKAAAHPWISFSFPKKHKKISDADPRVRWENKKEKENEEEKSEEEKKNEGEEDTTPKSEDPQEIAAVQREEPVADTTVSQSVLNSYHEQNIRQLQLFYQLCKEAPNRYGKRMNGTESSLYVYMDTQRFIHKCGNLPVHIALRIMEDCPWFRWDVEEKIEQGRPLLSSVYTMGVRTGGHEDFEIENEGVHSAAYASGSRMGRREMVPEVIYDENVISHI